MKKLFLLFILVSPTLFFAQAQSEKMYGTWNTILTNYNLNEKWFLFNEFQIRRTNFMTDWQQFIVRPSINYRANETVTFTAGYSYIKNYSDAFDAQENNVWEEVQLQHSSGQSKFKHRFRFEQRFIEQFAETALGVYEKVDTDFSMRWRYRLTWSLPLFTIKNKKLSFTVFDEIWFLTGKKVVPRDFNQNWFYVGVSYPILNKTSLSIGYMNDYGKIGDDLFRDNNVIQTTLKFSLN